MNSQDEGGIAVLLRPRLRSGHCAYGTPRQHALGIALTQLAQVSAFRSCRHHVHQCEHRLEAMREFQGYAWCINLSAGTNDDGAERTTKIRSLVNGLKNCLAGLQSELHQDSPGVHAAYHNRA